MTEIERKKEEKEIKKCKASYISFFICLGISIILMVGSAIVPPPFVIDESIFKAVGWLFGFAALGQIPSILDADKWAKVTHGSTTILVGDKEDMDRKRGLPKMPFPKEEHEYYAENEEDIENG